MSRRLRPITLDELVALPDDCRHCAFWELDPLAAARTQLARDAAEHALAAKESWVSATLLEWGSCGMMLYVDNTPAGYISYAPPGLVARSGAFPTSPVADDSVLLMAVRVYPEFAGGGLGRVLVQTAAKDLTRRGVRAIEAFGDARHDGPHCVVPADFLLRVGFKTVRPHHRYPRLRLELRNAVSWREDVEGALERLLGSITEPALRPI